MMRKFSRRLPAVAAILVLAVTVLATMASAGTIDKATPQVQVANTGEVWIQVAQEKQTTPETVVDLSPRTLVGNTGETIVYEFEGHDLTAGLRGATAILYMPTEADDAAFRASVEALTGGTVDYFDPRAVVPDLATLEMYDAVFTWVNYAYLDNVATGDNLAAYVDGGGKVILGQWCQPTAGNYLSGTIMTSAYNPVSASSYSSGAYNGDGTDCVWEGVTTISGSYYDICTLVSGTTDGTVDHGGVAAAWRDDRAVYAAPGNTGSLLTTGETDVQVANMVDCDDGPGKGAILYCPANDDNPTFRDELAACTGTTVDYFDPRAATPDVAMLSGYDMVVTWVNYAYLDNVTMGDNLAAYVDGGGKVVLGQWCLPTAGNYLAGAIMGEDYCPVTGSFYEGGAYNGDGIDCVHDGVTSYEAGSYFDVATLVDGALSDGTFDNDSNSLAVAWREDRMVYYSPGNTGGTISTGDWAQLTCNMFLCEDSVVETMPLMITGPGAGAENPPQVRVWDPADPSAFVSEWAAYGAEDYGVNVACGDLDDDGGDEIVTGPGPGAIFGPHVRAFTSDGTPVDGVNYFAYGTLKYGVNVACGNLDDDGYDEIVTGAGPGAVFGPHVRGWNVDGGEAEAISDISYFAYGTPKWGVNVACGDIDGDGYDEIVTGAGPGAVYGPHVRGWDVDGGAATAIGGVNYFAYGTLKYGVNVTCGDFDGDGIDEIVTGAGPGMVFGSHVRGWNVDGGTATAVDGINFFAYTDAIYGAQVALLDLDGDMYDELLTAPGPDPALAAMVRAWNVDGGTAEHITSIDFDAYSDLMLMSGGKIAGGMFLGEDPVH